jgi:hypothetical protein
LTTEELELLTADEFVRLQLTENEKGRLREINIKRGQERAERSARLAIEETPILVDLREIGLKVDSVWDVVNTSTKFAEAIPVLLKHLVLPYSDRTREGIARCLSVPEPEVRTAWPVLIRQYRMAKMGRGIIAPGDTKDYRLGVKDALACALSVAVTDETLPELIMLTKDRTQGESRVLLLSALKRRRNRNPLVKRAIDDLASDPDLEKEIASWHRR